MTNKKNDEIDLNVEKKLGIMQAYFFPYIGYFQLIDYVDTFIIYEHVSFRKKSWITRNRILDKGSNSPVVINVPIQKQSSTKSIKNSLIKTDSDWQNKILNLVYFNYKKAPYFDDIFLSLKNLITNSSESIHEFNSTVIIELCKLLGIDTKIICQNDKYMSMEKKLLLLAEQNKAEVKAQRIFEICKSEGMNSYVNPIGGTEIYDKEFFLKNDIKLNFLQTNDFNYPQFKGEFQPYLSIIDVLMHNGVEETKKFIKNYKVV